MSAESGSSSSVIDLRSDTVTRPSPAMREAMAQAVVGDDVYGEDPTVNRLQELAAQLVGKEASIFVPSGTMANQVAIRAHTEPGDAMVAGQGAHTFLFESGGAAAVSGVQIHVVGEGGLFGVDDVRAVLSPDDAHFAVTRLVCIENTHNMSGGRVFPLEAQLEIRALADREGLAMHLDGARLFNAALAERRSAAELAAPFDSVSFCLSKGLGAPVGSMLCGTARFIERAHRFRKMLGGGMRQAGILAAAGIYALEVHVKDLARDHEAAARLAEGIADLPGLRLDPPPETNIVRFRVDDVVPGGARGLAERARERGLWISAVASDVIRAVTHRDLSPGDVPRAVERIAASLS